MNILVVGNGWTGAKVTKELLSREHVVTTCSHTRVTDYLNEHTFDWVVNCAGVTGTPNVDACENDKLGTIQGNALFPIELSNTCDAFSVRLAHFSSGCIYEGDIQSPDALPNFFGSIYSLSKGISDVYLRDRALVFRIRMPFTGVDEQKNYLSKVLKYAKNGKLIDAGQNSLTDLDEAVRVACDLIEANTSNGSYNLVNSGSVNMHELVELLGITPQWYTAEEFKQATVASRSTCTIPAYGSMSPVRDALRKAIDSLDKQNTVG
jgi:dTDP-4-dehydrorhamnose reductase